MAFPGMDHAGLSWEKRIGVRLGVSGQSGPDFSGKRVEVRMGVQGAGRIGVW